jgi:hypothetical protein
MKFMNTHRSLNIESMDVAAKFGREEWGVLLVLG